ncbi:MAG: twin-arginine translocase TatA/TatE family subunit [Armatimonadia bacterium]|nr:twin-arginine translocase TatA/TatE family subunit [Armatimonadia bacterium]
MNQMLAFLGPLGTPEVLIIILVLLLLFGARKLPELLRGMGEGVKEFRKASREIMDDIETADSPKSKGKTSTSKATSKPAEEPASAETSDQPEEAVASTES